jgi:hypothetical protein
VCVCVCVCGGGGAALQSHVKFKHILCRYFPENQRQVRGIILYSQKQVNKVLHIHNFMLVVVTFRESRPAAGWLTQDG